MSEVCHETFGTYMIAMLFSNLCLNFMKLFKKYFEYNIY